MLTSQSTRYPSGSSSYFGLCLQVWTYFRSDKGGGSWRAILALSVIVLVCTLAFGQKINSVAI